MYTNIKKLIKEQFNINDIDFTGDAYDGDANIFNKYVIDPQKIFDTMMDDKMPTNTEIEYLRDVASIFKPPTDENLYLLVRYYSKYYPDEPLNWLDVSDVKNMRRLFYYTDCTGDISKWDVSNVTNMSYMFYHSVFNGDIGEWDVSNVRTMSSMFAGNLKFNKNISKWDVSKVKDMRTMFYNSRFNCNISEWDVSSVTDMSYMFSKSAFNQDISKWDVKNVQMMDKMFAESQFKQNISRWNVNNVVTYFQIFVACPMYRMPWYQPLKFRSKK